MELNRPVDARAYALGVCDASAKWCAPASSALR